MRILKAVITPILNKVTQNMLISEKSQVRNDKYQHINRNTKKECSMERYNFWNNRTDVPNSWMDMTRKV